MSVESPLLVVESVPIDVLKPHPRNPRQGDVGAIVQSIEANGLYRPLYVQRSTNYILAGTHTWRALKALGADSAPVIYLDVDDKRAIRILLADNRTSDLGSYDAGILESLLADTSTDLAGTGYDLDDVERMLKKATEPLEFSHHCCRPD